jgi:Chaperone of endosialidase
MKTHIGSASLITLALLCIWLPSVLAVNPPPDGGYPGGNTAEGEDALLSLTTGTYNTANGFLSLKSNRRGNFNTAIGAGALFVNIADENTAIGAGALLSNTTGTPNTAIGESALFFNTTGNANTATGANALVNNVNGDANTANGNDALAGNTTGNFNAAIGARALLNNTIGSRNTAIGRGALSFNTNGSFNTANGYQALFNNTTGSFNIALGNSAGGSLTTGDSNIDIGNVGFPGESNTIRIGGSQTKTFIAGIRGVTTGFPNAVNVLIDSAGQLGTVSSSRRFKHEIQPMAQASEALLSLKPVRFHYKSDHTNTPQFGLIAEEVAEVNPDLVVRDQNGEIYSVRYDAVNAMLLNEFLKEHRKVQEQQAAISDLKSVVAQQQKQFQAAIAEQRKELESRLKEQESKIQRVSAQIEMSQAAQVAANTP